MLWNLSFSSGILSNGSCSKSFCQNCVFPPSQSFEIRVNCKSSPILAKMGRQTANSIEIVQMRATFFSYLCDSVADEMLCSPSTFSNLFLLV